ncbi:MAG: InlB B-repeat-containing protein [Oscillospiraceae bacterium]
MKRFKQIMAGFLSAAMAVSMLTAMPMVSASADVPQGQIAVSNATSDAVNNILISGEENYYVSDSKNSETSYASFTPNCDYQFNSHNSLKIDYSVNQSDSYNGYAGAKLNVNKNVSANGATGIGFWYCTPTDQQGTIAFCMQGTVAKKLVQLDATRGLWKYYYTSMTFYSSNLSNIEMFINGNENGKVTDPSSGTIYLAEVAATNIEKENTVSYTLETSVEGSGSLTGTASGTYSKDTEVTLTAVPNDGYKLLGWIKNGELVKESETYKFTLDSDTEVSAVFGNKYANYCFLAAYAGEGGKVLNGEPDFYSAGAGVSVTAVADTGYTFKGWSYSKDGDIAFTGDNYISKLSSDTILYAVFEKGTGKQFHFCPLATEGGTVSGTEAGIYAEGTEITLTAAPDEGYTFVGWKTQHGDLNVKTTKYTFALKDNLAVTAKFAKNDSINYSFKVTSSGSGTVTGAQSGTYKLGTQITVKAVPDESSCFKAWRFKNSDHYFSIDDTYTFTLNSDVEIEAVFEDYPMPIHHLVVYCDEGGKLKEDVNGYYTPGQSAYLQAEPDEGYRFIGWSCGEENARIDIKDAAYRVSPVGETKYYAHFEKIPENTHYLKVYTPSGTLTGAKTGDYEIGSQVTVSVEPSLKFLFKGWKNEKGELVSTDNPYTFTMDSDKELRAYIVKDTRPYYTVELVDGENGSFSGDAIREYPEGEKATIKAKPKTGYQFVGWKIYGTDILVSRRQTYNFYVTENVKYQPVFDKDNSTVYHYFGVYSVDKGGSVSKLTGYHVEGEKVKIEAIPEEGFKFTGWSRSADGKIVSTNSSLNVTISASKYYYAHFEEVISSNTFITGMNNNGGMMNADNGSDITVTPNSMDYPFRHRGALKVDYKINLDNTYGGYAGRSITLDNTYSAKYGVEGIEFWYLTPKDYTGKIALCLQSSSTGLDDLVQLVSTNGEWRHFYYKTNKANVYNMTLYINGNKNGYKTDTWDVNTQGIAGTLYLANMATVDNMTESLKASILSKNQSFLSQAQLDELSEVINEWPEEQLMLYDKMADNFSENNYHSTSGGSYTSSTRTLEMDIDDVYFERKYYRSSKGAWTIKFHEEAHQLDDAVYGDIQVSHNDELRNAMVSDLTKAINNAIDWKYGADSDVKHLSTLDDLEHITNDAIHAIVDWVDNFYGEASMMYIQTFTDTIGFATRGYCTFYGYCHHSWGENAQKGIDGGCADGWADFCSQAFYPDTEGLEMLNKLMPETYKIMESNLKACREYANSHCLTFFHYFH